ncbi:hypothetical protein OHA40_06565 [Nocardia sp. NBC_00508]|uniref:hypothetical protein n=1 Tax=Nocardia sp. NBC_00508 TaxID=2975992 RepID=UPI002E80B687|nr:hypothetical protein [Nocardia sp. NBC_00508]WUD67786.1 hypothetical protein OHA40_06565 [Nocardia sp. NBC_00508]
MVDPVWAGVVGGAIGSGATLIVALASPFASWWVESRRLHQQDMAARTIAQRQRRRELVREWREGMYESHTELHPRRNETSNADGPISDLTGRPWFESLRPHLGLTGSEVAEISAGFGHADQVRKLATEVVRIERDEWKLI